MWVRYLKHSITMSAKKIAICTVTRTLSPIIFNYELNGNNLGTSSKHSYLSATLDGKLSWSSHVNNTASNVNRTLNFLKHNLSKYSSSVKESAYFALVCPYTSVVWDPYHNNKIEQLEKVQ